MALSAATLATNIRYLLKEATASYFSDAEITAWIADASTDISAKTLCYEAAGEITLVAGTLEYAEPTGCLKIASVHYDNKPLTKIHPKALGVATNRAAGKPEHYYHFAKKIGFWPLADDGAAAAKPRVLHAALTATVANIPEQYGPMVELYALVRAKIKEEKTAQASMIYQMYLSSLMFHRQDLTEQTVDAKSEFKIPDYNEIVQPAKE
jgi:hypothetical protein